MSRYSDCQYVETERYGRFKWRCRSHATSGYWWFPQDTASAGRMWTCPFDPASSAPSRSTGDPTP